MLAAAGPGPPAGRRGGLGRSRRGGRRRSRRGRVRRRPAAGAAGFGASVGLASAAGAAVGLDCAGRGCRRRRPPSPTRPAGNSSASSTSSMVDSSMLIRSVPLNANQKRSSSSRRRRQRRRRGSPSGESGMSSPTSDSRLAALPALLAPDPTVQPLTAPAVRPRTSWRWPRTSNRIVGSTTMTTPAMTRPQRMRLLNLELGDADLNGAHGRLVRDQQRPEVLIPGSQEAVYRQRAEGRSAERQHDLTREIGTARRRRRPRRRTGRAAVVESSGATGRSRSRSP